MNLDLVQYLSSKGVRTFRAAGDEVTAHCWACDDGNPKGKGKLYLNTESWLWSCKRCDARGNRKALFTHFGDEDTAEVTYLPGQHPGLRRKALTEAVLLGEQMLDNNNEVLEYLLGRGLSVQTIVDARLGYAPKAWSLAGSLKPTNTMADLRSAGIVNARGQEFFSGHILIPYVSHGDVVALRGKAIGGPTITSEGDSVRLYGADDLHGARDAVVVEGEMDRLMLKQVLSTCPDAALRQTAVVAVPGAGAFPQGFASYFEECRRVYLAFDPDTAGAAGAARAKEILGTKARTVALPDDLPKCDWNEYLRPRDETRPHSGHGWKDVQRLIYEADSAGRRLYTARDAHIQWAKIESEVGGIKLGITNIDRYIGAGIKPGQLLIPIARTGVGKTAFLANLVWNLRARPQMVISLEMTAAEFYDRLRKLAHFWFPLMGDEEVTDSLGKLRIVDQRTRPGDLLRFVDEFVDDVGEGPQVVHLDYIGYYASNVPGTSQYERVTKAVIGLKEDAKEGQFALIAPHQAGRTAAAGVPVSAEDARDSGAIEDTADIMIGLWRPSDADKTGGVTGAVQAGILKNRNGPKGGLVSLNFSLASLAMVQCGTPESRWVDDENAHVMRGEAYPAVRRFRQANAGLAGQQQLRIV